MPAPFDPRAIANVFLRRSFAEGRPIDHMKLQKLVYFAHGYYLAASQLNSGQPVPLIDEYFEAWPYGPVCKTVYEHFKQNGRSNISAPATIFSPEFGVNIVAEVQENDPLLDEVANYVWSTYASQHSMRLSDITHKKQGAWDKSRLEAHGLRGKDIPNEYILEDFSALVNKTDG